MGDAPISPVVLSPEDENLMEFVLTGQVSPAEENLAEGFFLRSAPVEDPVGSLRKFLEAERYGG